MARSGEATPRPCESGPGPAESSWTGIHPGSRRGRSPTGAAATATLAVPHAAWSRPCCANPIFTAVRAINVAGLIRCVEPDPAPLPDAACFWLAHAGGSTRHKKQALDGSACQWGKTVSFRSSEYIDLKVRSLEARLARSRGDVRPALPHGLRSDRRQDTLALWVLTPRGGPRNPSKKWRECAARTYPPERR